MFYLFVHLLYISSQTAVNVNYKILRKPKRPCFLMRFVQYVSVKTQILNKIMLFRDTTISSELRVRRILSPLCMDSKSHAEKQEYATVLTSEVADKTLNNCRTARTIVYKKTVSKKTMVLVHFRSFFAIQHESRQRGIRQRFWW